MPSYRTQTWTATKPAARGRGGVVVAQAREAAEAGAAVLRAGGNAVDAAVATAFALAAVEPWNSGLGGIGFMLVHRAGERRAQVVEFGPVSPVATDPAAYPLGGGVSASLFPWPAVRDDRNVHGPLSFAVPGAVDGLGLALERWGRLPLPAVLAPAIELAERGLAVDWFAMLRIAAGAATLRRYQAAGEIYLEDGLPPVAAQSAAPKRLPLGALAATLKRLAAAGRRDFYDGALARDIVADIAALGGVLSAADLAGYRARIVDPLAIAYRGHVVQALPGLTAGPTLKRVLERLAAAPLGPAPDAAAFVAYADALKAAYAERLAGLGDVSRAAETCTTHLTVADGEGTMVALTNTLLSSFGSFVVLPATGILMNNGMMWFDPVPGRPNSIAPAKRPLTNMCPAIAARDGAPVLAAGASGGRRILPAVTQALSFALDFGLSVEESAHRPRIDVSGTEKVDADRRLDPAVIAALRAAGHHVDTVEHTVFPVNFACPNLVRREPDGSFAGIADALSPWSAAVAA